VAFTVISAARLPLLPPLRAGPLTTLQTSRHAADRPVAPPYRAFDAGLRHRAFPPDAASLLPGLLAATRTGLTPASDDELTNTKIHHGVKSRCHLPLCWAHERSGLAPAQHKNYEHDYHDDDYRPDTDIHRLFLSCQRSVSIVDELLAPSSRLGFDSAARTWNPQTASRRAGSADVPPRWDSGIAPPLFAGRVRSRPNGLGSPVVASGSATPRRLQLRVSRPPVTAPAGVDCAIASWNCPVVDLEPAEPFCHHRPCLLEGMCQYPWPRRGRFQGLPVGLDLV